MEVMDVFELLLDAIALWPLLWALNKIEKWYRLTYRKDWRYIPSDLSNESGDAAPSSTAGVADSRP